MADLTGQLDDLILEMMEVNQNQVAIDKKITMSNDYLNNINANSWATFEQLHTIAGILSGNNLAALEKAKEDGAMQERVLQTLQGIEGNTKEQKKAKELDMNLGFAGILGGLSAFVGGFIKGYIEQFKTVAKGFWNIAKESYGVLSKWLKAAFTWIGETDVAQVLKGKVASFFAGISMQFDLLMDSIKAYFKTAGEESGILGKIKGFFTGVGESWTRTIDGWKDEFKIWKEFLGPIVTKIKGLLDPLLDLGARMDDVKGFFTVIKDTVGGWVVNIFDKVKDVLGILGGGDSVLAKIGKFFGKFLAPVTFLLTLWDTVQGAIEGYESGGIVGAVKGALMGFLASIVGEPLNLIKSFASWIAEKLGFEGVAKALDGFDFVQLIKDMVNGTFDWFKTLFTDPTAALTDLWNALVGEGGLMDLLFKPFNKLIDWALKKFGFRAEDAPEFSMGGILRNIWNGIIDWIADAISEYSDWAAGKIRALKAEKSGISDMGKKKPSTEAKIEPNSKEPPKVEKVANQTGDTLKTAATEKADTKAVAEAARDSAVISGVGGVTSNTGGNTVNTSASTANYNISHGYQPDRSDASVAAIPFGA